MTLALVCRMNLAPAAEIHWNGSSNSNWHNVNNWDPFGSPVCCIHRVPGDGDTANLLTPTGDVVRLGADTAPINGLTVGFDIELYTNGRRLHVTDGGNAETLIGAGGTIHVEPRTGGGFALETDRLVVTDGTELSLEGGDALVEGKASVFEGSMIVSADTGVIHFGGDVSLDQASEIHVQAAQFGPGAIVFMEDGSVIEVTEELNIPNGTTFDLRNGSSLETGSTTTVQSNGSIQLSSESQFVAHDNVLVDGGSITATGVDQPILLDNQKTFTAMNNAIVTTDRDLTISGDTTFEFTSGADLTLTSIVSNLLVGDPQLGKGTLIVDGNGSTLDVTNNLLVGRSGQGDSVTLANGAMGNVSSLDVGVTGDGNLTVEAGADLSSTSGEVGSGVGADGMVTVTGAGSTWMNFFLVVGSSGGGDLSIADGGHVATSFDAAVGVFSNGFVEVTDVGSTWSVNGLLSVGDEHDGDLRILDGGRVVSDSGFVGRYAGSTGTVFIQGEFDLGADTSWEIHDDLSIGGDASTNQNGGTGTLTIRRYSSVTVAQDTVLFPNGRVELEGGILTTSTVRFEGGGQFDWTEGTLHVDLFNGDLVNAGGTLAPGRSAGNPTGITTGITTIFGDYTAQANVGAVLEIQIGGTATGSQHDFVNIAGSAFFGGGLNLELIDGFLPDPDDEFIVLNANSIIGFFLNAGNGQRLDTVDGLGSFLVHYGPTSAFDPDQVVLTDFLAASVPGDYNEDGIVNAADYTVWRDNLGAPAGTLPNDLDGGVIGQAQYDTWKANFGNTLGSGASNPHSAFHSQQSTAVPEPSSGLAIIAALAVLLLLWRMP